MKVKCIVTGCAGFIGSHVTEHLLSLGCKVTGIDAFTSYYSPQLKQLNIRTFSKNRRFKLIRGNLTTMDISSILRDADYVVHEAAQPGVRMSWGSNFESYLRNNLYATQRMLEACRIHKIKKVVFASSSSVYGNTQILPTTEETRPMPVSPYGVSKLACEHLCNAYEENFGIPIVVLRYFSVYGPRQRPDMAFHKFLRSAVKGEKVVVFGGKQKRDFTYVTDVVDGTISAMHSDIEGDVLNIGSGKPFSLLETLKTIENITERKLDIIYEPSLKDDVKHTYANITKAQKLLNYRPKVNLREGLREEYKWISALYSYG